MFGITKQQILGYIAAIIYWPITLTFRYRLHAPEGFLEDPKAHIYAFWHQDDLALIPYFKNKKVVIMVSLSKDGRILATALEFFGYQTIAGSSSRRGIAALIQIIRKIRSGTTCAMAVDGPRGPIYKSKEGILLLSKKSDTPIHAIKAFPHKYYMFEKAWNRPRLPKPFSIIDVVVSEPKFFNDTNELDDAINSLKN